MTPGRPFWERDPFWWIAEMVDWANKGSGHYEIAIPVTMLEDWIANARALAWAQRERTVARPDNESEGTPSGLGVR